jgi:hypothetical protein
MFFCGFFSLSVVWFDLFYPVFGRNKRDKKNRANIPSAPKKIVTYLRRFCFVSAMPLCKNAIETKEKEKGKKEGNERK